MKFKNIKKKKYIKKSPSNSRTITESKSFKFAFPKISSFKLLKLYKGALKIFVIFTFVITAVIVGLDLQNNLQMKKNIDSQREILIKELSFWEDFISEHQNYRDAYFQASILEYRLGNALKAKEYVGKGLALDPNSQEGKKIEKFLNE